MNLVTYGVSIATNQFNDVKPFLENDELFQAVIECCGEIEQGWLKVKRIDSDNKFYQISVNSFITTFTPKFLIGQTVFIPRKSCQATIYGIGWHFKRSEYIYSLLFNNKRSSRIYFVDELEELC